MNITPKIELLSSTPNPETVIETAARCCYNSTAKLPNYNGINLFLLGIIKSGHESVLEHASATFKISNVSRALTHQLVRHRLASYSQQSQRYCELPAGNLEHVQPESIAKSQLSGKVDTLYAQIHSLYDELIKSGVPKEDARYILPNACTTTIVMTANFREWRHFLQLRLDSHAQWEIRALARQIFNKLLELAPNVFADIA